MTLLSGIAALLLLGVVIIIHEWGHMMAARRAGIDVLEFSVGMGPTLVSKTVGTTCYSLRALPIGGSVRMVGVSDETPFPDSVTFFGRLATLAAGSAMNILTGFFAVVLVMLFFGTPKLTTTVSHVMDGYAAQSVGIMTGDTIVAIDGRWVKDPLTDVYQTIHASPGTPMTIQLVRDHVPFDVQVTPVVMDNDPSGRGIIGIRLDAVLVRQGLWHAIGSGFVKTINILSSVVENVGMLIVGNVSMSDMAGPLGIIQIVSFQAQNGLYSILNLMGIISLSLGMINLLPIPALDGGHIVFLLIERIIGKPVSPKVQSIITKSGLILLMGLMAIFTISDIGQWAGRSQLFRP